MTEGDVNTKLIQSWLPESRQARISFCGAPMPDMLRTDKAGQVTERIEGATYRCADKYCEYCADKRSQRIYKCIESRLNELGEDMSKAVMCTLTRELLPGKSIEDFNRNWNLFATTCRRAHDIDRSHTHACNRLDAYTKKQNITKIEHWRREKRIRLAPPHKESSRLEYASSYDNTEGYPPPSTGKTTYIWSREVTQGEDGDRWHVHAHYLLPTRADAERLCAAWQMACKQVHSGVFRPYDSPRQTDISEATKDDRRCEKSAAARYITKYVTKSCAMAMKSAKAAKRYVLASVGVRQYDAAGVWRPLGVGKKLDPERDRVTLLEFEQWTLDAENNKIIYQKKREEFQSLMTGKSQVWNIWKGAGKNSLTENRTNLRDLFECMTICALANAMDGNFSPGGHSGDRYILSPGVVSTYRFDKNKANNLQFGRILKQARRTYEKQHRGQNEV